MDTLILFEFNENAANAEIERTIQHREETRSAYDALRVTLEGVTKKAQSLDDVLGFASIEYEQDAEKEALGLWLKVQKPNIPIIPALAVKAMVIPETVKKVVEAWGRVRQTGTSDPKRYWDENAGNFAVLPLSFEEEKQIHEKHKKFVRDETTKTALETAKSFLDLVNFMSDRGGARLTPGEFALQLPWLAPMVKSERIRVGFNRDGGNFTFKVDDAKYTVRPNAEYKPFY